MQCAEDDNFVSPDVVTYVKTKISDLNPKNLFCALHSNQGKDGKAR